MNIVNIIQRYPPAVGGSETWCQEVCRYLAKQGHRVTVLTMNVNREEEFWREPLDEDRTAAFGRYENDEGVHVYRYRRSLPINTLHHLFYKLILDRLLRIYFYGPHSGEMYGKMWREIKKADIVFLHTLPYPHNIIGYAIARRFGKKVVVVPHFHPSHPHYERWSNYRLLKKCDAVLTVSEFEKQYLVGKGVYEAKLFVTGNGVHPDLYETDDRAAAREAVEQKYGLQPGQPLLLFIGRKMPDKGVDTLLGAVRGLRKEMPIKLILAGPAFEWFDELYRTLTPDERADIIDAGVVTHEEKVRLLHAADLLVLPSKYEAFGIVFLEAWMCGTPVLGTKEGAMPSVIGKEGFLSSYGSIDDLRMTLRTALQDRRKLVRMGNEGKAKVLAKYTWNGIGAKVDAALRTVYGKKKILICANAYPPNFIGGAELIAHAQAKALAGLGNEVAVFAGDPNAALERYALRSEVYDGLRVWRVALHQKDYSAEFFNFVHRDVEQRFAEALDQFAPDMVHFHNLTGLSVGLVHVAKQRHIRTVLTLHDHWGFCHRNTLIKNSGEVCEDFASCVECLSSISDIGAQCVPLRMRRDYIDLQLKEVDRFITPSRYLAGAYEKANFPMDRFATLWNGIDERKFSSITREQANGSVRFTYVGYLGEHKGISVILRALERIGEEGRITVNFVGTGDDAAKYQASVRNIGWDARVRFWGRIDNQEIEKVYRNTDVLILPSVWPENQPVTITEAMASGIPVIASRIGGIPEMFDEGRSGFLFEPGNAEELAGKMMEFVQQPALAAKMGSSAAAKIKSRTVDSAARVLLDLYSRNGVHLESPVVPIVACIGGAMEPAGMEVIRGVTNETARPVYFVRADWLDDDQLRNAAVCWVTDRYAGLAQVITVLSHGIPLVVPAENFELCNACLTSGCGITYDDPAGAAAAIAVLLREEAVRERMGENGKKLL